MELLKTDKVNLKLLKNQFAFIFTLSICKICMFQSEKKKTEQRLHSSHSQSIAPHARTCTVLDWPPPPNPPYGTYSLDGPWNLPIFSKTCVKQLNPQICSKNVILCTYHLQSKEPIYCIYTTIVFQHSMIPHLHQVFTKEHSLPCLQKLILL